MPTYYFTAFDEDDLSSSGSLGKGDTFVMPDTRSFQINITDNDGTLSGDEDGENESADDSQYAAVYDEDGFVRDGTIYADESFELTDSAGNIYTAYQLEMEGTGQDFIAFAAPAPPPGTQLRVTGVDNDPEDVPYSQFDNQNAPTCFAEGTAILTPDGERRIEELAVGDMVLRDDGVPVPILWVGSQTLHFFPGSPLDKPVLIQPGALGANTPDAPLVVSSQHRILLRGAEVAGVAGVAEGIAAAKFLTDLPGIRFKWGQKSIRYHHLLTARHALIRANGAWCETLFPGPMALRSLNPPARAAVLSLCPALRGDPRNGYGPPARQILTRRLCEAIVARRKVWPTGRSPTRATAALPSL